MTVTPIQMFEPTVLGTEAESLYTAENGPSNQLLGAGRVRFTNTSNAQVTVTAYAVPTGGTAGASNTFLPGVAIPALSFMDVDIPVLGIGDSLQAMSNTASVVVASALNGVLFS
jgi:hypothetical protein